MRSVLEGTILMWASEISGQTFSCLRKLNRVPGLPGIQESRRINIERGREIASNLAFLSATSDNSSP